MWFFTNLNLGGSLDRKLVWLHQLARIFYLETYGPVVRMETIRTILHTLTVLNWEIKQKDVQNTFHTVTLLRLLYEATTGFFHKTYPNHGWLSHKALYGLRQSS